MKFYRNTDTVDIEKRQIGIHPFDTNDRELCIGITHRGSLESVKKATALALELTKFLNRKDKNESEN